MQTHVPRTVTLAFSLLPLAACTSLLGDFEIIPGGPNVAVDGGSPATTDGGGGVNAVTLTPPDAKVGVLRAARFGANVPVTWAVEEAGGGVVDAEGLYRAPRQSGVYHLVATSKADPSQVARATVIVQDLQLAFFAGGSGGPGNVDGPAEHAHFRSPQGIAAYDDPNASDSALFIADTGNHTIRKFDRAKGKVETLAGSPGTSGFVDATGNAARFASPMAVAADATTRKIYVADSENHCIRAVDDRAVPGSVTTFAGQCGSLGDADGSATVARFNRPTRLALQYDTFSGKALNLIVCEVGQRRMRLVTLPGGGGAIPPGQTTRVISSHAFNFCDAGVFDFNGGQWNRVYFIDGFAPGTLRRLTLGAATAENVASLPVDPNTAKQLTSASGFATDTGFGNGKSVYLSFGDLGSIYAFDTAAVAATGLTKLVGSATERRAIDGNFTQARFKRPGAMVLPKGRNDLFVIDEGAHAVRRVDVQGQTVAPMLGRAEQCFFNDGNANAARFPFPVAVATDSAGTVYVADGSFDGARFSNIIRKVDGSGVSVFAGKPGPAQLNVAPVDGDAKSATFGFLADLVVVEGDAIYATDVLGHAIRKITLAGGQVTTLAGRLGAPGDSDGIGGGAQFKKPGGLTSDGAGNLFVSDAGNSKIKKIEIATGKVVTLAGSTVGSVDGIGVAAKFNQVNGVAFHAGSVYVADGGDHTIRKVEVATGAVSTFLGVSGDSRHQDGDADKARLASPSKLALDRIAGVLYVTGVSGSTPNASPPGVIRRIDIAGRSLTTYLGRPGAQGFVPGPLGQATIGYPIGLTVLPSGDLVMGDIGDCSLGIVKPL